MGGDNLARVRRAIKEGRHVNGRRVTGRRVNGRRVGGRRVAVDRVKLFLSPENPSLNRVVSRLRHASMSP